jgi:hypothetical protein
MLTRRLNDLVKSGMLERRLYSKRPPRREYVLTEKGRDFWSVLVALMAYGNRHFAGEGVASQLVDGETGQAIDPALIDRASGHLLEPSRYRFAPGPAADAALRVRMRYSDERRAQKDGRKEWDEYARLKSTSAGRRRATRASR